MAMSKLTIVKSGDEFESLQFRSSVFDKVCYKQ